MGTHFFPDDILLIIFTFSLSHQFCQVCVQWRRLHHYKVIRGESVPSAEKFVRFRACGLRAATFDLLNNGGGVLSREDFGGLLELCSRVATLESLHLLFPVQFLDRSGSTQFGLLKACPRLSNLVVSIQIAQRMSCDFDVFAEALNSIPSLRSIAIHLQARPMHYLSLSDVTAIACLVELRYLCVLDLQLNFFYFGPDNLQNLLQFRDAHTVFEISVTLRQCCLDDHMVGLLSEALDHPNRARMKLNLSGNYVGIQGLQSLLSMNCYRQLTRLSLDLGSNHLGNEDVGAIVALGQFPNLQNLKLGLSCNFIGCSGAACIAGLRQSKSIRKLKLDLRGNVVGNDGAESLAQLFEMGQLIKFSLDLEANVIGPSGAQTLIKKAISVPSMRVWMKLTTNLCGSDQMMRDLLQGCDAGCQIEV